MHILQRVLRVGLVAATAFALPAVVAPSIGLGQAVAVSITVAPPPLPVYAQPIIPAPGYMWTPGYWAWGPYGYYWVPGTWVRPPAIGLLWTPGYWAWVNGGYFWRVGYWGPHIGFYGGVNYGFGYFGVGFFGGRWDGGHFFYNRAVTNFGGVHITNVYNAPVHNVAATRVSFNGGQGGIAAGPNAAEQAAANEHHVERTAVQTQHEQAASGNHALLASVNHGRPAVAATAHAGTFAGPGVVHAGGAAPAAARAGGGQAAHNNPHPQAGHPPANHPAASHPPANRPAANRPQGDRPEHQHP